MVCKNNPINSSLMRSQLGLFRGTGSRGGPVGAFETFVAQITKNVVEHSSKVPQVANHMISQSVRTRQKLLLPIGIGRPTLQYKVQFLSTRYLHISCPQDIYILKQLVNVPVYNIVQERNRQQKDPSTAVQTVTIKHKGSLMRVVGLEFVL